MVNVFRWQRAIKIALFFAAAACLGGCAVTPDPIKPEDRLAYGADKLDRVTQNQEPISGPIDLYEATARALKYNLDAKVEAMQHAVELQTLDLSNESMLPAFTASTAFANRDNDQGSRSKSLLTGRQSLEASTSSDRLTQASDLSFSWNILDFGLSYIRAHQQADQALLADETRRKVISRIVADVRTAYWRAASGERLLKRLKALERRTRTALTNSRTLSNSGETSPLAALTFQRELIGIRRDVQTLEGDLIVAKSQLAALMNVPPGVEFTLVHTEHANAEISLGTQDLIEIAMSRRPELAEFALKQRVNDKEATAALLALLPGFQLYADKNYDTNSYVFNGDWISWGSKATWNLLRVYQYPAQKAVIEAKGQVIDEQALALTMAIMTQVHVSRIRYLHALSELKTAREFLAVQSQIMKQISAQHTAGRTGDQALIREEMNTLLAEAKRDVSYAALQNALGSIYSSIGLDPVGIEVATVTDVKALADMLRRAKPGNPAQTAMPGKVIAGTAGERDGNGPMLPNWKTFISALQ